MLCTNCCVKCGYVLALAELAKGERANKSNMCFADKVKNDTLAARYLTQPLFSFKGERLSI